MITAAAVEKTVQTAVIRNACFSMLSCSFGLDSAINFDIDTGSSRLAITTTKNGRQNTHVEPHAMLAKLPCKNHVDDEFKTFCKKQLAKEERFLLQNGS